MCVCVACCIFRSQVKTQTFCSRHQRQLWVLINKDTLRQPRPRPHQRPEQKQHWLIIAISRQATKKMKTKWNSQDTQMKCSKWERRKKRPNKAKAKWNLPEAKNIWYPTNYIDLVEIYKVYTEYFLVNYSIILKEYIQKQTNLIYFSGSATPTWLYNPLNYSTTLQGYSQQGCILAQAAFNCLISTSFLPHTLFSHTTIFPCTFLSISLWLCSLLVIQCHSAAWRDLPCDGKASKS